MFHRHSQTKKWAPGTPTGLNHPHTPKLASIAASWRCKSFRNRPKSEVTSTSMDGFNVRNGNSIDSLHWHICGRKIVGFRLAASQVGGYIPYFISYSSDSSVMVLLKSNRQVFFSSGRRNAPEECILFITGGVGWEALQREAEIRRKCVLIESLSLRRFYTFAYICDRPMRLWLGMQRTAVYNIPVVLGVASSWQKYLDLPATYKTLTLGQFVIVFSECQIERSIMNRLQWVGRVFLIYCVGLQIMPSRFYWWTPDDSFLESSPTIMVLPPYSPRAWSQNDVTTASEALSIQKLISHDFEFMAADLVKLLQGSKSFGI